jgi:hypothetical protein
VDFGVAFSVHDQEDAHTPVFASGDPTHFPAGSGLADDREVAHALAIMKWYSFENR